LIEWLPPVYTLLVLGYAALLDVKSREVPPVYWALAIAVGLPISLAAYRGELAYTLVYHLSSLAVVLLAYAMYRLCLIGGADVLAFLTLSILAPRLPGSLVPALYLAILYSAIPGLAYHVYSAILACGGLRLGCIVRHKFSVKARLIVEDPRFRWWLVEGGGGCSIEGDPRQLALRASGGDLESYITASPGHPYIAHLAVGYALALLVGDEPLIRLALAIAQLL